MRGQTTRNDDGGYRMRANTLSLSGRANKGDFWFVSDGFHVSIAEQKTGDVPTQGIRIPKSTFDYFVKKYTEQQ